MARRFDGEFPERFMDELLAYLSLSTEEFPAAADILEQPVMDRASFIALCDRFRSPHIWMQRDGAWELRHTAWDE